MSRRSRVAAVVAAGAWFALLAVAVTHPLVLHLGTHLSDPGDPAFVSWILAWDVHALGTAPSSLFDANILFPLEKSLALSEHLLGAVPLFAPVYLATGNPVTGYNVLLLASFVGAGLAMLTLAHYWTGSVWASLLAGTLFAFAPARLAQVGHLQLLLLLWAPLAFLFLDRFLRARRWRDLVFFALCYWMQALSSAYLAVIVTFGLTVYVAVYLVRGWPGWRPSVLLALLAFAAGTLVVLGPTWVPYFEVRGRWGQQPLSEARFWTPDVLSYLTAPPFMNGLYRKYFAYGPPSGTVEKWLFPGLVLTGLALLGLGGRPGRVPLPRGREGCWLFAAVTLAAFVMSLGPFLRIGGLNTGIPLPFLAFYHLVPGFSGMRVPGRFVMLVILGASVLAAVGTVRVAGALVSAFPTMRPRVAEAVASLWLMCLFLAEFGWASAPLAEMPTGAAVPRVYTWLRTARPGPIVEIPIATTGSRDELFREVRYLFLSSAHWLPLVNGYTTMPPRLIAAARAVFEPLAGLPARQSVNFAAHVGIAAIVVHSTDLSPAAAARWSPDRVARVGLRRLVTLDGDTVYAIPALPAAPVAAAELLGSRWLPVDREVRLGIVFHCGAGVRCRDVRPYREYPIVARWTDPRTGWSGPLAARLSPWIVPRGDGVLATLSLTTPARPAEYRLDVSLPSIGVAAAPRTLIVRADRLPTSEERSTALAAVYESEAAPAAVVGAGEFVELDVVARNTGPAAWSAESRGDGTGAVRLGWRWFDHGQPIAEGRSRLGYDVLPGEGYTFGVSIPPPERAGRYALEVGLVSDFVAWFSDLGTPPVRLAVDVGEAPR